MTRMSPVVHRHDLWLRLRDLAEEILTLTDEWRTHDPELEEIDQALDQEDLRCDAPRDPHEEPDDDLPW